jgi:excisionase family DNA binding protein
MTSAQSAPRIPDEANDHRRFEIATSKPFSPETLAERWGCSAEKVRQMFHRGELAGFRLGKLIRIPASEVERFEVACSQTQVNTSSSDTVENTRSRLARDQLAVASRVGRLTLVTPAQ